MGAALKRREKLGRRTAHDLVLRLARHGNHSWHGRFRTDADVKRFFENNRMDFQDVVEQARNPYTFVPLLENLAGPTFVLSAPGGSASFVNLETGEEESPVAEHGQLIFSNYEHAYEQAAAALERAIAASAWGELLTALTHGVASIEAYISHQANNWNRAHPESMLEDSKQNKVSMDDKIDDWIPMMTGGKKVDKSDARWADFKMLRRIRDDAAIHIKASRASVSFEEMARLINATRTGIAGFLVQLHEIFGEPVPSKIIRGRFAPDVEVVVTE